MAVTLRVARDDSAVKPYVNQALTTTSRELLLEAGKCRGGRNSIQGHVNDGCDPPEAAARVPVSKPSHSGAARFIEVDMRVHEARKQKLRAVVDILDEIWERSFG